MKITPAHTLVLLQTARASCVAYGWQITDDGLFVKSDGRVIQGVTVSRAKTRNRMQVRTRNGDLLWSGAAENVGNFLRDFWFVAPISQTKD